MRGGVNAGAKCYGVLHLRQIYLHHYNMNPLLDLLPLKTHDHQQLVAAIEVLAEEQHEKFVQQALHRCISKNYFPEYIILLSYFLPTRLGCGSLLGILIEKDRPEMFLHTWKLAERHDHFHSQLIHMYGDVLRKLCHWTDLNPIKTLLTSPLVGQMNLNNYKHILNDVLYQCARDNNTELFVYLLDQVDHKFVDEYCYWSIIEHKNIQAIQAAIPYMIERPHPHHLVAYAWEDAFSNQNFKIFELMSSISQPDQIQQCLKGESRSAFEDYITQQQADRIEKQIQTPGIHTPIRKI